MDLKISPHSLGLLSPFQSYLKKLNKMKLGHELFRNFIFGIFANVEIANFLQISEFVLLTCYCFDLISHSKCCKYELKLENEFEFLLMHIAFYLFVYFF